MTDTPRVPAALADLAALYNVRTSYVDAHERESVASPDALTAVLAALGAPVTDVAGAVRAERLRRHTRVVEPVVALRTPGVQVMAVGVPRPVHPRDCWLSITDEEGRATRSRLMPAIHRPLDSATVEHVAVDRYEVRLGMASSGLAPGYHRLTLEGPGIDVSSLLVVAPRCPVPRRGWGAFLPVHSMRTRDDWGVGNYRALGELARWVRDLGGSMVGVLPLYPALLDGPMEVSPYLPATRLGWNELYVDPVAVKELDTSVEAQAALGSDAFTRALAAARQAPLVDYRASMALVRRALEPMARSVYGRPSPRLEALERFAALRPDMLAYARFRGGLDFVGADRQASGPESAGGGGGTGPGAGGGASVYERLGNDEARYHFYAQFVAAEQVAAAGDDMFLDMPIGTHPQGFDVAFEPAVFAAGVEGGAPPDLFYAQGQRWGFRPWHPQALREQGYRHLRALLRHVMARAKVLRIDHVMGLYRLYWVPDGAPATDGAYVGYRADELRAVVSLEAHRSGTAIVGEDLGTVPDEVRVGMAEDRMLRSWVLEFQVTPDAPLPEPPELSMATVSTHDLDRFVTFYEQPQQAAWRRVTGGDAARALRASLDHMAQSPARSVMVDLEDLWLERWPHNRPATGPEAGNWQHRCARLIEDIVVDPALRASLARVDDLRRQEGAE